MKKRLVFAVLTALTTVDSSAGNDKNLEAIGMMYAAHGKASQFLYDELRTVSTLERNGINKPEATQDRLAKRLLDLQQRHEKVIGKCGPGIEKERGFGGITLEGRAGGWDTYQPSIGPSFGPSFGSPFGPVDQGLGSDIGAGFPLSGQATADQFGMGFDGASFGYGFTGGSPYFGQSGAVGLGGNFDPLGARDFAESYRKRRFAENEKMTKGKIKKSIQRLNKSFEPMETFLDTQLENCSQARISRLKAKVNKAKGRIEKVLKRQGESLLQKQRKKRKN